MERRSSVEERQEYNKIPVYYCRNCLSLAVKIMDAVGEPVDYCADCGATNIGLADIYEWRRKYFNRYGKQFSTYNIK